MKILVVAASKHSSTDQIAEAIGRTLRDLGHIVQVCDFGEVGDIAPYDAAIIGSAIYMGHWLVEARQFVDKNQASLSAMPVWLFSSGPLGHDDPQPRDIPANLQELMQAVKARDHKTFAGALDKSKLGMGERLVVKMVKGPEGDFRDWEAIRGWAGEIAAALPFASVAIS
jgi:menaquinone-dependent protoporphyrinogen oxidase